MARGGADDQERPRDGEVEARLRGPDAPGLSDLLGGDAATRELADLARGAEAAGSASASSRSSSPASSG